jgi:membrane associated rhomboid family serine protease
MPFLPLFDSNPRVWIRYPWVTWGLIALCVMVFLLQIGGSQRDYESGIYGYGFISAVFGGQGQLAAWAERVPSVLTLITSLFLHGDWLHLAGNMLFLWVFGDNIEDAMGHWRFLVFYLLAGIAATLAHFAADPASMVPVVGASGAISGVLGAYLLLYPRSKVLVPILIFPLFLPAYLLLIFWIGYQVLAVAGDGGLGGVAWWAHIGGFLAGMVLVVPFRRKTTPLFGGGPLPQGLRMRRRSRWSRARNKRPARRPETRRRPGPWG